MCTLAAAAVSENLGRVLRAQASRKIVQLTAHGYVRTSHQLEVELRSGAVYVHEDVPLGLWVALLKAGSKGRIFNDTIRVVSAFTGGSDSLQALARVWHKCAS